MASVDSQSVPAPDRLSLVQLGALALQLGLATWVVHRYAIESRAFVQVVALLGVGFLVHAVLPAGVRQAFFAVLSIGAIFLVLGPVAGGWVVGLGLGLVGLCHLPGPYWLRVLAVVLAGGGLAVVRGDWIRAPVSAAVWPILGSMFMFRIIVYLYDVKHEKVAPTLARTLSYFFMAPNVCFPLFPVVDYRTFRRTWYDAPAFRIYQKGMLWIVRGLVHLVLYRLVDYHLTLAPGEVEHLGDLLQHVFAVYLLYLRVSGQFHVVVGFLHLFGFNLPETHHLYFLAPNLNEYWRRINIYWKDFMMKVFYYPLFFRLRRFGGTVALLTATGVVFVLTWLLHSYQWFWLRGSFPIVAQDMIFWGLLGVLVMYTAYRESRRGRARSLRRPEWTLRRTVGQGAGTAAIFFGMAFLWSLWMADSVSGWLRLWQRVFSAGSANLPWIGLFVAVVAVYVALAGLWLRAADRPQAQQPPASFGTAARCAATLGAMALVIPLASRIGGPVGTVVAGLAEDQLGRQDRELLERGYYEELVRVDRLNSRLWELYNRKPQQWQELRETPAARPTGNYLHGELVPLSDIWFKGARMRTNRWGMRDRPYALEKAPGTFRIAVLGASHTMGSGVRDGETFENVLEDRLNADPPSRKWSRFEVLNFATAGYSATQQVWVLQHKVLRFEPDAILYVGHATDTGAVARHLMTLTEAGIESPYAAVQTALDAARGAEGESEIRHRLAPYVPELLEWSYRELARQCRDHGIVPIWGLLPRLREDIPVERARSLQETAESAGFEVINLFGVYQAYDAKELSIAAWDDHPNPRGHVLVAERLVEALTALGPALGWSG